MLFIGPSQSGRDRFGSVREKGKEWRIVGSLGAADWDGLGVLAMYVLGGGHQWDERAWGDSYRHSILIVCLFSM